MDNTQQQERNDQIASMAGVGAGMMVGARVGTVAIPIPVVGTFVGAMLGGVVGGAVGQRVGKAVLDGVNAFLDGIANPKAQSDEREEEGAPQTV